MDGAAVRKDDAAALKYVKRALDLPRRSVPKPPKSSSFEELEPFINAVLDGERSLQQCAAGQEAGAQMPRSLAFNLGDAIRAGPAAREVAGWERALAEEDRQTLRSALTKAYDPSMESDLCGAAMAALRILASAWLDPLCKSGENPLWTMDVVERLSCNAILLCGISSVECADRATERALARDRAIRARQQQQQQQHQQQQQQEQPIAVPHETFTVYTFHVAWRYWVSVATRTVEVAAPAARGTEFGDFPRLGESMLGFWFVCCTADESSERGFA